MLYWNISDGKKTTENLNDTRSNTELASVEDPLNMHKTASNEITLVSEISNIIDEENVIIAPKKEETPVSTLSVNPHKKLARFYRYIEVL